MLGVGSREGVAAVIVQQAVNNDCWPLLSACLQLDAPQLHGSSSLPLKR